MKELLLKLDACPEAIKWVGDKTLQEAWDTCKRGDWMLWLYARSSNYDIRKLTLANGHCANTVRHLMLDSRSIAAVDAAIAFGEGRISSEELSAAAAAAAAAYAAAADRYQVAWLSSVIDIYDELSGRNEHRDVSQQELIELALAVQR